MCSFARLDVRGCVFVCVRTTSRGLIINFLTVHCDPSTSDAGRFTTVMPSRNNESRIGGSDVTGSTVLQTPRLCDTLQKYINKMGVGDFVGARFLLPQWQPGTPAVPAAQQHDKHVDVSLRKFERDSGSAIFDEKAFYNKRRVSGPGPVGGTTCVIVALLAARSGTRFLVEICLTFEWRSASLSRGDLRMGFGFLSSWLLNSTTNTMNLM